MKAMPSIVQRPCASNMLVAVPLTCAAWFVGIAVMISGAACTKMSNSLVAPDVVSSMASEMRAP